LLDRCVYYFHKPYNKSTSLNITNQEGHKIIINLNMDFVILKVDYYVKDIRNKNKKGIKRTIDVKFLLAFDILCRE